MKYFFCLVFTLGAYFHAYTQIEEPPERGIYMPNTIYALPSTSTNTNLQLGTFLSFTGLDLQLEGSIKNDLNFFVSTSIDPIYSNFLLLDGGVNINFHKGSPNEHTEVILGATTGAGIGYTNHNSPCSGFLCPGFAEYVDGFYWSPFLQLDSELKLDFFHISFGGRMRYLQYNDSNKSNLLTLDPYLALWFGFDGRYFFRNKKFALLFTSQFPLAWDGFEPRFQLNPGIGFFFSDFGKSE